MISPPRSADVKTKCETAWESAAVMRPEAWDSSEPGGPWTVTQKRESMCVFAVEKIASGAVGSPCRRRILGDREAKDCARLEVMSRVRAKILKSVVVGVASRALMTEEPWVPVAPIMR